jgi:mRNA-degrading endonuclease RelE of RelBE toxin-antitoxin system
VEFIEAPAFTRSLATYLDDEAYRLFQAALIERPESGPVVPGTGGFRKVRWRDPRRGKGKRGGLRVIYYYFPEEAQLWLVTLYDKDQADDLTSAERKTLQQAITVEKAARAAARRTRP